MTTILQFTNDSNPTVVCAEVTLRIEVHSTICQGAVQFGPFETTAAAQAWFSQFEHFFMKYWAERKRSSVTDEHGTGIKAPCSDLAITVVAVEYKVGRQQEHFDAERLIDPAISVLEIATQLPNILALSVLRHIANALYE